MCAGLQKGKGCACFECIYVERVREQAIDRLVREYEVLAHLGVHEATTEWSNGI